MTVIGSTYPGIVELGSSDPGAAIGRSEFFELSVDLLATMDLGGHFVDVNPAAQRILGFTREELIGRRAIDLLHPADRARTLALTDRPASSSDILEFENRYRRKDGAYRWLQWNARLKDGTWYAVARDVTDRRLLEESATRDPLTGLPNRAGLTERLVGALARLGRAPRLVAVMFVDLDHFKKVNDGSGHAVGDRLLGAASARLLDTVRAADTVSRFGGDEFVILLENVTTPEEVSEVAGRVVQAFQQPIAAGEHEAWVGASVGVTITALSTATPEALLQEADIAMYRAKARGGGCFALFDDEVRAEVEHRVVRERELRIAVDEGQLRVYSQPIVRLPETEVSCYEALLRWEHPTRGLLLPGDFMSVAEDTGIIVQIGEFVLREACRQLRRWRETAAEVAITVNVSTRQLNQPEFPDLVRDVLAENELPPEALWLEVTERAIMKHVTRVAPRLEALREIGVRTAIDDFGSGYSSLSSLRALPLDIIKIDKSCVRGIVDDPQDRAIVAAIINLGRQTSRAVIAEGVETERLHAELIGIGCDLAQGYFYDRPRPADELSLFGSGAGRVRRSEPDYRSEPDCGRGG